MAGSIVNAMDAVISMAKEAWAQGEGAITLQVKNEFNFADAYT